MDGEIRIKGLDNGFVVLVSGTSRDDGAKKVFKHTEEAKMLEYIGHLVLNKRIYVKENCTCSNN